MPTPGWPTAAPFVPEIDDLEVLRAAAQSCLGCPLHENATQAVFGRGTTEVPSVTASITVPAWTGPAIRQQ